MGPINLKKTELDLKYVHNVFEIYYMIINYTVHIESFEDILN